MAEMHGPILDGRADAMVAVAMPRVEKTIADRGVNLVRARLGSVLKHPTGYYESHIVTDRSVGDIAVTDSGVIYGPWLEGVGSRNSTTRFKGYRTFRLAGQELNAQAGDIAEREMQPTIREIGG